MPERIQLRRTRGWRKPVGAVVVARPSKWGNPFRVGAPWGDRVVTPEIAVRLFIRWLDSSGSQPRFGVERAVILRDLDELRGHDLACWCPVGQPCHGDVLLARANDGGAA